MLFNVMNQFMKLTFINDLIYLFYNTKSHDPVIILSVYFKLVEWTAVLPKRVMLRL